MEYADIVFAVLGTLAIAWVGDMLRGSRGFGGAVLVAGVGAVCGWFLAIRVFGDLTMEDWRWTVWSLVGAAASMVAFHLFRSKR